jgi:hypothetical protein
LIVIIVQEKIWKKKWLANVATFSVMNVLKIILNSGIEHVQCAELNLISLILKQYIGLDSKKKKKKKLLLFLCLK